MKQQSVFLSDVPIVDKIGANVVFFSVFHLTDTSDFVFVVFAPENDALWFGTLL